MSECRRPQVDYPCRVPFKIFGKEGELDREALLAVALAALGPEGVQESQEPPKRKGPYLSYTLWVTLPDERAELPLREAIARLPGYVMQL